MEIPAAGGVAVAVPTLQRVPEHLAEGRRIRSECRGDARRQRPRWQAVELLDDARTRPVELDVFLEDDVDRAETEYGVAPHVLHAGHAEQRDRQRVADLVIDVLRAPPGPVGEDDLLVLADVGDRVDGDRVARQPAEIPVERRREHAPEHDADRDQHDEELLVDAEPDQRRKRAACVTGRLVSHGRPL